MPQVGAAIVAAFKTFSAFAINAIGATGIGKAASVAVFNFGVNLLSTVALNALQTGMSGKQKVGRAGAPNDWKSDPAAPVPSVWGRFGTGGFIVLQKPHGNGDKFLSTVTVLSLGPVEIERQWFGTDVLTETNPSRSNGNVTGPYADAIWTHWQNGATPEALALPVLPTGGLGGASVPEWTSAHKLSGFGAVFTTFDVSYTEKLPRGIQKLRCDVKGHRCYDPRKDSTYPGGSGSHRLNDPATWEWSENGGLCALKHTLGIYHNNVLRDGIAAPVGLVEIGQFVEAANWADDNDWTCGGVSTTADSKFSVLSALLESAGGVPIRTRGKMGVMLDAPALSVGSLTDNDCVGPLSVNYDKPFDEVFNTAIPRFASEDHGWEQLAGSPVSIGSFVASDGQKITREVGLAMVTDADQAAQIAAYKAWASRVSLTVSGEYKLHAMRYREGECVTLTSLRAGIIAKKMRIVNMSINPASWTVSVVMIEELDARHADALSKTTTPPPVGDFNITGDIQSPIPAEWTLTTDHDGSIAFIDATGDLTNIASLTAIAVYYRLSTDTDWTLQVSGPVFTPFTAFVPELPRGTDYDIGVQYIRGTQSSSIIEVGSIETA